MKKIIKYIVFGFATLFAALGFGIVVVVFVGYTSGVFDKPILIGTLHYKCLAGEGKFESYYKENELIGVCEYEYIQPSENLYGYYLDDYNNHKFKQDCKQDTKEVETDEYGIVESAEYGEDKRGRGFCKKRVVFWIKGQPKETIRCLNPYEPECDNTHRH